MDRSEKLYRESLRYMPGGVNSPVRAFRGLDLAPRFIVSGKGSRIRDEDGREYIDYIGAYGPHILGHGHPAVIEAVERALARGTSFGAPTALELELAKKICDFVPSIESVRLVSSGTEATMSAIRLARAATRRDGIIKFEGCYHGHGDSFLIRAGSGALTFGVPDSPGVPDGPRIAHVRRSLQRPGLGRRGSFEAQKDRIAALIVEPVAGNMGVVPPAEGFLRGLRELCDGAGALLIFDEVMSGFPRRARRRAGALRSPTRSDDSREGDWRRPSGGRLWRAPRSHGAHRTRGSRLPGGDPLGKSSRGERRSRAARSARDVERMGPPRSERRAARGRARRDPVPTKTPLRRQPRRLDADALFLPGRGHRFRDRDPLRYEEARRLLPRDAGERGVHLPPSQYEALFVSLAHETEDLDRTIEAAETALSAL